MTALRCIVIAWSVDEVRLVRERRTDLGERPEMATVREGRACVWLNEGTADDVAKAEAYLRETQPDGRVFVFATGEADVLAKARAAIVEAQR